MCFHNHMYISLHRCTSLKTRNTHTHPHAYIDHPPSHSKVELKSQSVDPSTLSIPSYDSAPCVLTHTFYTAPSLSSQPSFSSRHFSSFHRSLHQSRHKHHTHCTHPDHRKQYTFPASHLSTLNSLPPHPHNILPAAN